MRDDDFRHQPARARGPVARRLAGPVGLLLAASCLLLPFMSASCAIEERPRMQWRVTYTGADLLTGGEPDVAFTDDADERPIHRLDENATRQVIGTPPAPLPTQPVAWVAVVLMTAALAATALPSRTWRTTATAGLALAATVVLAGATVLARRDATDAVAAVVRRFTAGSPGPPPTAPELRGWEHYGQVSDTFGYGYGFWTAIAALSLVGVANTVGVIRDTARDRDGPPPAVAES